jgi:hypothetical protein
MATHGQLRDRAVPQLPRRAARRPPIVARHRAALAQLALVFGALLAYMTVRFVTRGERLGAIAHAETLLRVERGLGIDWEQGAQRAVLRHRIWQQFFDGFYVWAYWPVVILTLLGFWRRDRHRYRLFRDSLFVSGTIGLVIFALYPVAPPRMLDGFTDTVEQVSRQHFVAHPNGLVNEYAALPSFHAGWFLLASLMVGAATSRLVGRVLAGFAGLVMVAAVVVTANHFVIDVLAGAAISLVGFAVAVVVHRGNRAVPPDPTAPSDRSGAGVGPPLQLDEGHLDL